MKTISLTKGKVALVDDQDYEWLNNWTWHCTSHHYAARRANGKLVYMHRLIMNPPSGKEVDHIDHNPLNNQRSNLRCCTHQQNQMYQGIQKNSTSGFIGVHYDKRHHVWQAQIQHTYIGTYPTKELAAKAYDMAAQKLYGDFANLNFST